MKSRRCNVELQSSTYRKASPAHRFRLANQEKIEGCKKKATKPRAKGKCDERRITKKSKNHGALLDYQPGSAIACVVSGGVQVRVMQEKYDC